MNKWLSLHGMLLVITFVTAFNRSMAQEPPVGIKDIQVQQVGKDAGVTIFGTAPLKYRTFTSEGGDSKFKINVEITNAVLNAPVTRDIPIGPVKRVSGVQWSSQPPVVRFSLECSTKVSFQAGASGSMIGIAVQGSNEQVTGVPVNQKQEEDPQPHEKISADITIPAVTPPPEEKPADIVVRGTPAINRTRKIPTSLKEKMDFMQYRKASITSVLRAFAEQYNLNIVIAKDVVDDMITVRLQDVSLKGAIDAILTANGYNYIQKENIILVKSRTNQMTEDMKTEIYKLNYLNANDIQINLNAIKSERGNIQMFIEGPIGTVGVELPITGQMGGVIGGGGGGGGAAGPVVATQRSNVLIITEVPEVLEKMKRIIYELDHPRAQVRIEVKLIETKLDDKDRWGVNWTSTLEAVGRGGQQTGVSSGGGGAAGAGGAGEGVIVPGIPLYLTKYKFGTLSLAQFRVVMEFLQSRGNTKLLNQPSISVLDNQQADISVGSIVPIEVSQIVTSAGGGGGAGGQQSQVPQTIVQQQPVTISLTVIPRVNEDKYITLWVQPKVNEISAYTGKNADLPVTSLRAANTQVRVKDGDTVVIGGLIKEDKLRTERRVKFLWQIPLIGRLFRHVSIDSQKSELLIFITPYIIRDMEFVTQKTETNH